MSNESKTHLVLRLGLAFAFLYPPFAAILDPVGWGAYFPHFLLVSGIPTAILLHGFGIIEAVLAVWILSGWNIKIPATLCAILLILIVVSNLSNFDVVFRDVSIAAIALALMLSPNPRAMNAPA